MWLLLQFVPLVPGAKPVTRYAVIQAIRYQCLEPNLYATEEVSFTLITIFLHNVTTDSHACTQEEPKLVPNPVQLA